MNGNVLDNISLCSGCGACYNICPQKCISMKEDSEGFLYPICDLDNCINCNLCKIVCPSISSHKTQLINLPEAYIGWANDISLREQATSGGAFSAIAKDFLHSGGIVYGAAYDKDNVVNHIKIESENQLCLINRSKYVQSNTKNTFYSVLEELKNNKPVLYSGTTCQIYGLLSFLKTKKVKTDDLYTIDLVCHGVPSPKLLREYLKFHEEKKCDVLSISMREKKHPSPFFSTSVTAVNYSNGEKYEKEIDVDYYGRLFFGDISSRPICYQCNYKSIGRLSDLTVGDCWFSRALTGKKEIPFDVTLCLVQSEKGKRLIQSTKSLSIVKVDTENAIKCNGGMIYSSISHHPKRDEFYSRLGKEPIDLLANHYFPLTLHKKKSFIKNIIKSIPGLYKAYYFRQKKKEYIKRCGRKIPENAYTKIII